MIKNIFFDFDGVILDSNDVRELGFRKIFEDFPQEKIEELIRFHLINGGLSRYVKIRFFYENVLGESISDKEVNEWADKYSVIMRKALPDKKNLILETVDFIQKEYRNFPMHIVSGSDGKELNFLCKELDLAKYFITVQGSPTPKTELVAGILEKYNYNPNECVLIGDSINDYDSAVDNGLLFWGYNNSRLKGKGEQYLDRFKEAYQYL